MAREVIRKTIEFRQDLFTWLDEYYPKQSWWILNSLLEEFKNAHGDVSPAYFFKLGAQELKAKLEIDLDPNDEANDSNDDDKVGGENEGE